MLSFSFTVFLFLSRFNPRIEGVLIVIAELWHNVCFCTEEDVEHLSESMELGSQGEVLLVVTDQTQA